MFSWFNSWLKKLVSALLLILPTSPFQAYIQSFADLPYLGYLNWFIPIADLVIIGGVWLGAIALFYIYSIAMRWVKMIGN